MRNTFEIKGEVLNKRGGHYTVFRDNLQGTAVIVGDDSGFDIEERDGEEEISPATVVPPLACY